MKAEFLKNGGKPYIELKAAWKSGQIEMDVKFPDALKDEDEEEAAAIREALSLDLMLRLSMELGLSIDALCDRLRGVNAIFWEHHKKPDFRNN